MELFSKRNVIFRDECLEALACLEAIAKDVEQRISKFVLPSFKSSPEWRAYKVRVMRCALLVYLKEAPEEIYVVGC
jgi:hypothetical protein